MKNSNRELAIFAALPVLEAAARHNNFTRAAREFGLTQSALSRRIQALEADLGIVLFARRGRSIILTEKGAQLAEAARASLDLIDAARHDLGGTLAGTVRVGILPSLGSCWLIPRLPDFRQKFPEIVVQIETIDADFREERKDPVTWDPSSLDVVITRGYGGWRSLVVTKLTNERMIPIKLAGASTSTKLEHSTRTGAWQSYREKFSEPLEFNPPALIFEHFFMIVEAVRAGLGIGLVPELLVLDELLNSRLEACGPACPTGAGYYALSSDRSARKPSNAAFIEWMCSGCC